MTTIWNDIRLHHDTTATIAARFDNRDEWYFFDELRTQSVQVLEIRRLGRWLGARRVELRYLADLEEEDVQIAAFRWVDGKLEVE